MPKALTVALRRQFSERLKELRESLSMQASSLAKAAKVSPASVWHWEHAGAIPRTQTLNKLATALGTSPRYLLGVEEQRAEDAPRSAPASNLSEISLEDLIGAIAVKGFRVTILRE